VVSGVALARGYLNNPLLTEEKFNRNPYIPDQRLYRTGDRSRQLENGKIEFLGRIDHQVKIRGYRIEIAEIESRLSAHPEISESVVVKREDESGHHFLCAYYILQNSSEKGHLDNQKLRSYLNQFLPDYMIPSYLIKLNTLPLTPNGKLDYKSLPLPQEVDWGMEEDLIEPRNQVEEMLCAVWEQVLGRKNISIKDNFFMIGGDSIKTIQIASRMRELGYKVEMRHIFRYPTISDLSSYVKKLERIADQSLVTGNFRLTPIQKRFFEKSGINRNHYNQAVMLNWELGLEEGLVKSIFKRIQEHHDILRTTFHKIGDTYVGKIHKIEYPLSLQVEDFKGQKDWEKLMRESIEKIQGSIDLEKGPMMRLALFRLNDGDRLLIIIHHLVVDGVTWRILFQDIETLFNQHCSGESLVLPQKSDSYKHWSDELYKYANSKSFLKEKSYWKQLESKPVPELVKDFNGTNRIKDIRKQSFQLNTQETNLLLTGVNNAFNTEINDILITAMGLGFRRAFGDDRVLITLEGHGREEIIEEIDISRTLGWFTCICPVVLNLTFDHNLGRQIKEVKETLHQVPNKGIGYGILKHITSNDNKSDINFNMNPKVVFNYLGQFDTDVSEKTFKVANESTGPTHSRESERNYELDVYGMISNERLVISIVYSKEHYEDKTIKRLLEDFQSSLTEIITYCSQRGKTEFTPCDFTYKKLSVQEVETLNKKFPIEDMYPLSPMQEGMLFHSLIDKDSYAYFEQMSYRIQGELEVELVQRSLNQLLHRYEILRTVFVYENLAQPLQLVLSQRTVELNYLDIKTNPDKDTWIRNYKEKDKKRYFNLQNEVLMRVHILHVDLHEYEFIWSFHHILMDGWCMGILFSELFEIYYSFLEKRSPQLSEVYQYKSYVEWLQKIDKEASGKYWKDYLEGFDTPSGVPEKNTFAPGDNIYLRDQVLLRWEQENTSKMKEYAGSNNITLNTLVQAVWGILLGKYNGFQDIVFGAVVSGRASEVPGIESMLGLFINTIPVRIKFEGEKYVKDFFDQVQEESLESQPHHYFLLSEIKANSILKQNLFDHIFIFENYPVAEQIAKTGDDVARRQKIRNRRFMLKGVHVFEQTNYHLNLMVVPGRRFSVRFDYNANVYDREVMERVSRHFSLFLHQIVEEKVEYVKELTLLSYEERMAILNEFNDTEASYPKEIQIHEMIDLQAQKHPHRRAIRFQHKQLTYNQLQTDTEDLALALYELGVKTNTIVGIMVYRSLEMMKGILGILKAGGAYLPLDPLYPKDRIQYMIKDSGMDLLLHQSQIPLTDTNPACATLCLENPIPESGSSIAKGNQKKGELCYVIYTSGSTGTPKGVMINHPSVLNRILWMQNSYPLSIEDVVVQKTPFVFDVSVWELFWWGITGASLIFLEPGGEKIPDTIVARIEGDKITTMHFVPSMFGAFLQYIEENGVSNSVRSLIQVFCSGEALGDHQVEMFSDSLYEQNGTFLVNLYGPTEATVDVSYYNCQPRLRMSNVPIGKPIDNTKLYVLDQEMNLEAIGIPGELCISGDGVGRGYVNQVELTHDLFKPDPFSEGQRIYRTGDIARWKPDGNIEYLGRKDDQVKIRGFRIELGEIEERLRRYKGVKDALVIAMKDKKNEASLCAYIIPSSEYLYKEIEPEIQELKDYLVQFLPIYMIPSYMMKLEEFPLTANGKINRKELPKPKAVISDRYVEPKTDTEKCIAELWRETLGVERVGLDDIFFELGGTSLDLIRLSSSLSKILKRQVPVVKLFRFPTISSLVRYLGQDTSKEHLLDSKRLIEQGARKRKSKINQIKKQRGL
jgi:amino acid adenylation domain-containing protein/non-ribosomal peptide synthase protein (TIGR01720 family)